MAVVVKMSAEEEDAAAAGAEVVEDVENSEAFKVRRRRAKSTEKNFTCNRRPPPPVCHIRHNRMGTQRNGGRRWFDHQRRGVHGPARWLRARARRRATCLVSTGGKTERFDRRRWPRVGRARPGGVRARTFFSPHLAPPRVTKSNRQNLGYTFDKCVHRGSWVSSPDKLSGRRSRLSPAFPGAMMTPGAG